MPMSKDAKTFASSVEAKLESKYLDVEIDYMEFLLGYTCIHNIYRNVIVLSMCLHVCGCDYCWVIERMFAFLLC